jgi:hypothetical protein
MNLTNATLVEIASPGPLQGNGDPGTPQTVWTGAVVGYLKRARRTSVSGSVNVPSRRDSFVLLRSQGAPAVEQAGGEWEAYTVVIVDRRTPTAVKRRYMVRGMENRAASTKVDSIRLELDPEGEA